MNAIKQTTTFPESQKETLCINAHLASMAKSDVPYGLVSNAAITIHDGRLQCQTAMRSV